MIRFYLFGTPRLELNDTLVKVDTRKAIALLAYLALTDRAQSRDSLAALLWPENDQTSARAALRRTLSTSRKALPDSSLVTGQDLVELSTESIWVDVLAFRQALAKCNQHGHASAEVCPQCKEPLLQAASLHRDHFMAGFSLRDSASFDDWQFFQGEGLRLELSNALERLSALLAGQGECEAAISHARSWLALDPLREEAHRQLMLLYAWSNQRNAALRQYRECVRILEQELGVAPLEETTRLYQAILENVVPGPQPPWRPPSVHATSYQVPTPDPPSALERPALGKPVGLTPAPLPMIGRADEVAALLKSYQEMSSAGNRAAGNRAAGKLVAIEGEAGIGKTRLADEFLSRVAALGAAVITARCYEGEAGLAYGPLVEGLRQALADIDPRSSLGELPHLWLAEATRLLPELAGFHPDLSSPPPLDGPGSQGRFFEGISRLISHLLKGPTPGVLYIDDLHWADASTLDLLAYLARRLHERPLFILATWRRGSAAADQRLQALITELHRKQLASLMSLARLSQVQIEHLARAYLGEHEHPGEGFIQRLFQETEGLPFFILEYLAFLGKDKTSSPSDAWPMPRGVQDLLHARLATLDDASWQVLSTAAVIGRSFDFDILLQASGRSELETVNALETLLARVLVYEQNALSGAPIYDFSHTKLRQFAYEQISLARRRLLHRRVAEALVTQFRSRRPSGALASQIAYHYQNAGQDQQAAEHYYQAGEQARSVFANSDALEYYRLALALGHPEIATLHESIGDLLTLQGEYSLALSSYEIAASTCGRACSARLEHKLANVHQRRGEWEQAICHFQEAQAVMGSQASAAELANLYADWSRTAHHQNQPERAAELAHLALEQAMNSGQPRPLAQAYNILGMLSRSQGNLITARQHLEQSLSVARLPGVASERIAALNNLSLVHRDQAHFETAIQLALEALELCQQLGDRHREAALQNNLADLYHAAGQQARAMEHLKLAVLIFAEIGLEGSLQKPEIWMLTEW